MQTEQDLLNVKNQNYLSVSLLLGFLGSYFSIDRVWDSSERQGIHAVEMGQQSNRYSQESK